MPTLEIIFRWAVAASSSFQVRFPWAVQQRLHFRFGFPWSVEGDEIWHLGRRVLSSEVNDTTP